jgi:hypothetical protein
MELLEDELNYLDINQEIKNTLINIYDSQIKVKNNHIYIENDSDDFIAVGKSIIMQHKISHQNIDQTKTLFLSKCNNIRITIGKKINHIIIENCKNITLKLLNGLISGIDILHSLNVNIIVENSSIHYLSYGSSTDCSCKIQKNIAYKLLISTILCYNIILYINDNMSDNVFFTNQTLFSDLTLFTFENNNKLLYATSNDNGEIYPN